jgi:lipopolysaccharide export system permease protein
MTIVDRYLLKLYSKVLVVSFVSLAGLFIVIDGFNNLDEFLAYGKRHAGGTAAVLAEYYGPRLLQFFDNTSGLLAMLAAGFVLTVVARTNELTALFAAGIAPARVLKPLVGASILVAFLGAANREYGLPLVRDSLSSNAQDLAGDTARKCTPRYDIRTDILIAGQSTFAKQKRLAAPQFGLPPEFGEWGRQISAQIAFYRPATSHHPAGYLLRGVKQPSGVGQLRSLSLGSERVLFSPADTPWLKPDECFVASVVTFEQLSVGGSWRQNLSTVELVTGLRGQTIEPGADVWVTLHARLVRPLLDLSLVLMGIPLVLSRASRNIFMAAGIGGTLVSALLVIELACHSLGKSYLISPTLAAWLPLLVFGPMSYTMARPLWD